jgi:eukaryotic-like serine/threonine-protein kinase
VGGLLAGRLDVREVALDEDTVRLLVGRFVFMLRGLKEAEKVGEHGFESTSWRGQLLGFRYALEIIVGYQKTNEILDMVREETHKSFGVLAGNAFFNRAFLRPEHMLHNLYFDSIALGLRDKSLSDSLMALELNPISARRYACVVSSYMLFNQLAETQAHLDEAWSKNIDCPAMHFCSYVIAFLNRDLATMEEQVLWGKGKANVEHVMFSLEARTHAFFGRLTTSREFSQWAVDSAELTGTKFLAASYQADAALREALFGHSGDALRGAECALRLSDDRDVIYEVALARALAGDAPNAQLLLDELNNAIPKDKVTMFNYLPTLNAQLALTRNDALQAVEFLVEAIPYELGDVGNTALFPVFVRGEAFLMAERGEEAATEFCKILENPGIVANGPVWIRALLGLARAHAKQRDNSKAISVYEDFLTLWRNAEPEIPILKQAKVEYAKLQ